MLDEVDAALDEANTERFCNLLDDFISESQFLIVTHAKRTMTYADVIFGVTMQESGVIQEDRHPDRGLRGRAGRLIRCLDAGGELRPRVDRHPRP